MLSTAIKRAFAIKAERGWDSVYWAIDLHGVCLQSTYEPHSFKWINEDAPRVLRLISKDSGNKIILWSSAHEDEQPYIIKFFADAGINVFAFNANPAEKSTTTGCFDKKFYFSILLDDKAGFEPDTDWITIENILNGG